MGCPHKEEKDQDHYVEKVEKKGQYVEKGEKKW